jgi:hypothetical protein
MTPNARGPCWSSPPSSLDPEFRTTLFARIRLWARWQQQRSWLDAGFAAGYVRVQMHLIVKCSMPCADSYLDGYRSWQLRNAPQPSSPSPAMALEKSALMHPRMPTRQVGGSRSSPPKSRTSCAWDPLASAPRFSSVACLESDGKE